MGLLEFGPLALEGTCDCGAPQARAPCRALPRACVQLDRRSDLKPDSKLHLGADTLAQDGRDLGGGSAPLLQPCPNVPEYQFIEGGNHVKSDDYQGLVPLVGSTQCALEESQDVGGLLLWQTSGEGEGIPAYTSPNISVIPRTLCCEIVVPA